MRLDELKSLLMTGSKLPTLDRSTVLYNEDDCIIDDVDVGVGAQPDERSFTDFNIDSIRRDFLDIIDLLEQENYDEVRKMLRKLETSAELSAQDQLTADLLYLYADAGLIAHAPELRCKTRIQRFYDNRFEELATVLPEGVFERLKEDLRRLLRVL